MVTKLDWLQTIKQEGVIKTRIEHFGYKVPGFGKHLRTWGGKGVVKLKKVNKVDNYSTTCIFIGCVNHHSNICYRMWDPETSRVHETCDILWLHQMFWTDKLAKAVLLESAVYLDQSDLTDMEEEDITDMTKGANKTGETGNKQKSALKDIFCFFVPPVLNARYISTYPICRLASKLNGRFGQSKSARFGQMV